jgi:hypothetical protein
LEYVGGDIKTAKEILHEKQENDFLDRLNNVNGVFGLRPTV